MMSTACAKGSAMGHVSANEAISGSLPVIPGREALAPRVKPEDPDVDIARKLDKALLGNRLHVRYAVHDRVITLTGSVNSTTKRARAAKVALAVADVRQVVNELQVKRHEARLLD